MCPQFCPTVPPESPKLSKPILKHLGRKAFMKNIFVAICLSGLSGFAFKILYCNRRIKAYKNYYQQYDPNEHYDRMRKAGLMSTGTVS